MGGWEVHIYSASLPEIERPFFDEMNVPNNTIELNTDHFQGPNAKKLHSEFCVASKLPDTVVPHRKLDVPD